MSVTVHNVDKVYKGKIFDVAVERITLPNGMTKDREVVRHPGAAAMVPILDSGQVLLVKQYRHAVNRYLLEIPAGTLEADETPETCARRELIEEVGHDASSIEKLGKIFPAPGYTDECIHIYLMRGLTPVGQQLEDDEVLEIQPTSMNDAVSMISRGEIQDAKTITGLLLTSKRLGTGGGPT